MIITLTTSEIEVAEFVGRRKEEFSVSKGFKDKFRPNSRETSLRQNIDGAASEMAVAKHLKAYWPAAFMMEHKYDIYPNIQVRSTRHLNGCLCIRKENEDNDGYYLVIVLSPDKLDIKGWLYGYEGKRPEHWREEYGSYFVTQNYLRP